MTLIAKVLMTLGLTGMLVLGAKPVALELLPQPVPFQEVNTYIADEKPAPQVEAAPIATVTYEEPAVRGFEPSRGGNYLQYRCEEFRITAYEVGHTTSLGETPISWDEEGPATVAVDPSVIPYGTRMFIPYFAEYPCKGFFIAGDCGGDIKRHRLDVRAPSAYAANQFGVRDLDVYILNEEVR